jgi:hypothetical protein
VVGFNSFNQSDGVCLFISEEDVVVVGADVFSTTLSFTLSLSLSFTLSLSLSFTLSLSASFASLFEAFASSASFD